MRSRSERQTRFDQLAKDEAQGALSPRRPAEEAINSNRKTSAQRQKRSTPTRRTGARRVKDQRQTSTAGLGQGRRTNVNSVDRPALLAKDQRQTPHRQHSLVGDATVYPCNRDHAPRFLWLGNLGKSLTAQPLLPRPEPDVKTFAGQPPQSFNLVTENFNKRSQAFRR